MTTLELLTSNKDEAIRNALEVLKEAAGMGFEAVVVVGIKNGQAFTCKSKSLDTLSLVGAVEFAKHAILTKWGEK